MQDNCCLPILHLNTGLTYYQAFCSQVKQSYQDAVHFAFSSVHSLIPNNVKTPPCSCKGAPPAVTPDTDYTLGQDVLHMNRKGNQARVVYKGATPNGQWHTLCKSDNSKLVAPAPHLFSGATQFFKHRCMVGVGLLKEEAQWLAYPCTLSLAQQKLLSWHHCLYHLSFGHLFWLARWKILPQSILACEDKPPLCVACQFGQAHCHPWHKLY
jgi:hypothetical protein